MTASGEGQGYAHPELLADTAWLQEHLDDPKVRVIDCDPIEMYRRAHIRNAVGLRVHHYLKQPPEPGREYGTHVMVPDQLAGLMGDLGVGQDTQVVTYDGAGGVYAARVWWVLNYHGHRGVKLLNGGWNKWFSEGRPMSMDVPSFPKAAFEPRMNPDLLCTLDYTVGRVGKAEVTFWDVRSDGEWTGENTRGNRRGGHIPGAVHLEWLDLVTDDALRTLKPAAEMRALLEAAGVTPDREVITY